MRWQQLTEAFEIHPTDLNSARNLIVLARLLDRPDEAIQWADRAISLIESGHGGKEQVDSVYRQIVEMNSQYGPIQESVEVLLRLFSLAPNDYRIPVPTGSVTRRDGR